MLPSWAPWAIVGVILLLGIGLMMAATGRKRGPELKCKKCGRVMLPEWTTCKFCGQVLREQRAELEFISGPLVGQTVALDRQVTKIGAGSENTVVLHDTGVSRMHIGILRENGSYTLADLGSVNGAYVNGEKVAKRVLQVGDVIRIGTTEIVYRI